MTEIVKFILLVSVFVFTTGKTLCPVNWAQFKGECLYFARDTRTWSDAQRDCRNKGGYLATDDTTEKHDFIRQILSVLKSQSIADYFIGADDYAFEGQWRWQETGMPVSFTAWGPGMPQGEEHHDCLQFTWANDSVIWIDADCNRHHHYICERQLADFQSATNIIG